MCEAEWFDFTITQYRDITFGEMAAIYPPNNVCNLCSANSSSSFVIGPNGELYKCWEDVGKRSMIIGSVLDDAFISNPELERFHKTCSFTEAASARNMQA